MTVSSVLNKITYPGNASQTMFPFTFDFPDVTVAEAVGFLQVFYVDASGNITQLANGPAASQYQLTLNSPISPNPTIVGGSITYNPSAGPIALGTSLTIYRNLPLDQDSSFANQGTIYPNTLEQALDYNMMVAQQVLEVQDRAIVVPVTDPIPSPLPPVAQRANLGMGFDVNGNPIAISLAPSGTISSAMAPVVAAASLAAGRTAFGLGSIATESIGLGLEDNGSGAVQTFFKLVTDAVGQSVTSAFHSQVHNASAPITYTFPLSSTLFNGFGFWIYASAGAVTLAINAADSFYGGATGQSIIVPPSQHVFISTDAAGNWYLRGYRPSASAPPENASMSATVAAGAMTINLLDYAGNAPSASSPVFYTTVVNGALVPRAITGALSITVPSGATLGTVSGLGNRIWVGIHDNSGTPILGVYNSLNSTGPTILSWNELLAVSGTSISVGSTSSQVWYTSAGTTSKAFRILGFVESTQATAGTWSTAPSLVGLFGPGIKRPGDTVQTAYFTTTTGGTSSSATYVPLTSGPTISIIPTSAANLIDVLSSGVIEAPGANVTMDVQLSRGSVAATNMIGSVAESNINAGHIPATILASDLPNTTSSVTYVVQGKVTSNTFSYGGTGITLIMTAKEIQI